MNMVLINKKRLVQKLTRAVHAEAKPAFGLFGQRGLASFLKPFFEELFHW